MDPQCAVVLGDRPARGCIIGGMESSRVPVDIDAELVARAEQAGVPTGRSATAVVEDAVRAYLGADVIDIVRERNRDVDSDEIAELARAELKALRHERRRAPQ